MNYSFPGLIPAPQFLSSGKVPEIQTEANVLNPTSCTAAANASLFQESNHHVTDYCDKSVFTTAPSHINSNNENRPSEWINIPNRSSVESEKKVYSSFTVTPSSTHQTVGVLWQSKTMTQNVSTMTDWETPENLCKSTDSRDDISKPSTNENDFVSHCSWNSCSKIHLQRQGNAMAVYLERLQPRSLPLSIQQFLNRHNIKPIKDNGLKMKPKSRRDFKPRNSEVRVITDLNGITMFCCPECRTAYPERERLEAHMTVHKSERRFQCNVCGACLKRKEHLDQHKRRHSEERPFVCEICCKGFKRNEHLRRHFIIHSGNKMYPCPLCSKAFSRKDHLNKHALTHVSKEIKSNNMDDCLLNNSAD